MTSRLRTATARHRRSHLSLVLLPLVALLLPGIHGAAPVARADGTSMVAEWSLDVKNLSDSGPTTPDRSGNGYTLVEQPGGSVSVIAGGRFSNAFDFSDFGEFYRNSTADLQPDQLTVLAWVKGDTSPGADQYLVAQGGTSGCAGSSYALYTGGSGGLEFYVWTAGNASVSLSPDAGSGIWDGQWHAVAGVYDGSAVHLYVDGTEVGTGTPATGAVNYGLDDEQFALGAYPACSGFEYGNQLDEVQVYNGALTASEINYLQTTQGSTPPQLWTSPPPVETDPPSAVGTTTATVTGQVTPNGEDVTDCHFDYGTDTNYSSGSAPCIQTVGSGSGAVPVSANLSGLQPGQTYDYRLVASNMFGPDDGSNQSFTTSSAVAPTASTGGATNFSTTGATLTGSVTPEGGNAVSDCHFDYGTSATYTASIPCAQTVGSGASPVNVSASLSGLSPGTSYDFRLVAGDVNGTAYGTNQAFTTNSQSATARLALAGRSTTIKSGYWFNPNQSVASTHAHVVDYAYDISGHGYYDWHCLPSAPFAAMAFPSNGLHTIGLKVTDSLGHTSTSSLTVNVANAKIKIPTPVLDCEAPAPGQQQPDRADCVKSIGIGIIDANSRGNPNDCFAVVSHFASRVVNYIPPRQFSPATTPSATHLDLRSRLWTIETAKIRGPVAINGLYFPVPEGVRTDFEGADQSFAVGAVKIGIGNYLTKTYSLGHVSTVPDASGRHHLGDFSLSGSIPGIEGFPIGASFSLDLQYEATRVGAQLRLPNLLTYDDGSPVTIGAALLISNENPMVLSEFHLHIPELDFGAVSLSDVAIDYVRDPATSSTCVTAHKKTLWISGNIDIAGAQVRMAPTPPYGVIFQNGNFRCAGVEVVFGGAIPPPELFPGIFLDAVGFHIELNPTVLAGNVQLNVLGLASVNGTMLTAFPTPDAPFILDSTELPDIPDSFNGRTFSNAPVIGVSGDVQVNIPVVGTETLATGYLLYAEPGYLALGGGVDWNILGIISFGGRLDGEFNSVNHRFNVAGRIYACVADVVCGQALAAVSSQGAGGCVSVGPVSIGGGVQWARVSSPFIWPIDGCKWTRFTEDHVYGLAHHLGARLGSAQPSYTVQVKKGSPAEAIQLNGSGGAPDVTVSGPTGQLLASPSGAGLVYSKDGHLRIMRSQKLDITSVGIENATPGTYVITPNGGSPTITSSAHAYNPAAPSITGKVVGTGSQRTLKYSIAKRPGQTVTFLERTSQGVTREIGSVNGSGSGSLRFTPSRDKGKQTIQATTTMSGVPVPGIARTIATFSPPLAARLAGPKGLSATDSGKSVRIRWNPVAGAGAYRVVIRQPVGGALVQVLKASAHSAVFPGLDPSSGGVASVFAVDATGTRGRKASIRFTAPKPKKKR